MPLSKIQQHLFESEPGDAGGGSSGGGGSPSPQPETFSKEYVRELREENKGYRLKAHEAERKAQEAEERIKKASEEADAKIAEANKSAKEAANDRVIRAELRTAALKAGMVDLDGLKLADLSKVKLNEETGEVEGADDLMKELKEAKPYLFQSSANTSNPDKPPPKKQDSPKKATEMSNEEWEAEKKKYGMRF